MRLKTSVILTLLATFLFSSQASAHDLLVDIDPAPNSVVEVSEFDATLTFNNPLLVVEGEANAELSTRLVGTENWSNHEISIIDRVLTAKISLSEPGDYELRWKVVSSDGHPISGDSTFTLNVPESETPSDSTEPILIAPAPAETGGGSMVGFYVGLAMVILGVIFAPIGLIIRRRAKQSEV